MQDTKSDTAKREEGILEFWEKERIFEKSLEKEAPQGEYIFYDGPPFATGLPHHGSLLSSVIKDVIPRYKTMQGFRVARRWGWDCHGLPIENLVEKKLGLKTKKDIEKIGVAVFNREARMSVLRFAEDWKKYIKRIGRWVDFDNSYKTMDTSYIESVWWGLKQMYDKGLLYEGKKVLMYCPHCETPLAKAEIAADNTYKDITEEAVTVKFKIKDPEKRGLPSNSYLLAWTTTPWTLPGNVALAVGKDISYVPMIRGDEHLFVARERAEGDVGVEKKGAELLGLEYEPLYGIPSIEAHRGKKHIVVGADFVTTTEGTGIVHTAVMYGEDDFKLGEREKLPMAQLLDASAKYNAEAPEFLRGTYIKDAEFSIKEDLERRALLFARAKHTHSYPHCWRCNTPLIYNAVSSWFINIQKVKAKMLSENECVTWVPEHLKAGRFRHIVENAPDWTISRNRYWASPLPIWRGKKTKKLRVVGSVEELLSLQKKSGNRYFLMRHGEAKSNGGFVESKDEVDNPLTEGGVRAVAKRSNELRREGIDLIVASPVRRARETAELLRKELGLPENALMFDERLREVDFGMMNGKSVTEWDSLFKTFRDRFSHKDHGGENYTDVRNRVGDFLFEIERRYIGKRILIVSHGTPLWLMRKVAARVTYEELLRATEKEGYPRTSEWMEMKFVRYPRNEEGDLDLHRPYIDEVQLRDEGGEELERTPEVVDCWVESGSMPFAQHHYLGRDLPGFDPKGGLFRRKKGYPADFIAEYIAQTRTWFYYMHAVGALLFKSISFKNVVTTGNVLAADGSKMSKSKGNYTDPLALLDAFGADAYRFHLMSSVVMQAEDVMFRDEDVREAHNRVIGIFANSYKFFELYKKDWDKAVSPRESSHVLDRWIFARLNETVKETTAALDIYDLPGACRMLRAFVEDYSTWYVRRSRERVKAEGGSDKNYVLGVQREVLLTLAKVFAPLTPFIAETIYQGVEGEGQSVHLAVWPSAAPYDEKILSQMKEVRSVVSRALEERNKAGIKVRQPLALLTLKKEIPETYRQLIRDEVNVKEVRIDPALSEDMVLDTNLTDELRGEGMARDAIRAIQDKRKEEKLIVSDQPSVIVMANIVTTGRVVSKMEDIKKGANLLELTLSKKEELADGEFEIIFKK